MLKKLYSSSHLLHYLGYQPPHWVVACNHNLASASPLLQISLVVAF